MYQKVKETISTFFLATSYSMKFMVRSGKTEIFWQLALALSATVLGYLIVFSTGYLVDSVQLAMAKKKEGIDSLQSFLESGLLAPTTFFVVVAILCVVIQKMGSYYQGKCGQLFHYANKREIDNHRASLDVARFRSQDFDNLCRRIENLPNGWRTRICFANEASRLLMTLVSFVLFGTSLAWQNPLYGIILIGTALPMVIIEFQNVGLWWNLFQELVPAHKKRHMLERPYHSTNAFVQALMFNQLPTLRKEIDISVDSLVERYNETRWITNKKGLFAELLAIVGLASVIIHAVWMIVNTHGQVGALTITIASAKMFQGNIESIVSTVAEQWNSAKGVILIEDEFFGMKPLLKTEFPVVPQWTTPPPIRFENVSFAYPDTGNKLVLRGVDFTIEPGSKVAIVGKSGNGKSTIQALLMRHYDPTSGAIFAGGVNLRNIRPEDWATVTSALTQEYAVLDRTIATEIASSRLEVPEDRDRVIASARFANFDEVVGPDPNGYDAQIGTEFGGREFSGGERQRLALARVHYRGTPILILDEPDAKLDPEGIWKLTFNIFSCISATIF